MCGGEGRGGESCTHISEKRRILMRTAEVKSRLEDIGLNRTILLKWILKFRMGGSGPDWTHMGGGLWMSRVRSPESAL